MIPERLEERQAVHTSSSQVYQEKTQVRGPVPLRRADLACSRPAFVPRRFSHYQYDRGITFREAARLQSFPDEFEFVRPRLQVARQIGNALPPLMARAFAVQIGRALGSAVADDALSEELVVGGVGVAHVQDKQLGDFIRPTLA